MTELFNSYEQQIKTYFERTTSYLIQITKHEDRKSLYSQNSKNFVISYITSKQE